jgi:hypothetical protein
LALMPCPNLPKTCSTYSIAVALSSAVVAAVLDDAYSQAELIIEPALVSSASRAPNVSSVSNVPLAVAPAALFAWISAQVSLADSQDSLGIAHYTILCRDINF